MTIPSLTSTFSPSATLLSPTRIDVTASHGICKGPVVLLGPNFHALVLDSPAEIHIQFQEKISLSQTKVLANSEAGE